MDGTLKETHLYPPLKAWLETQGYTVRGEVGRCDLAAEKDGVLIAIELKLRPSLVLLAQAAERQEYADSVYIALPATPNRPRPPSSRNLRRLLSRLGIGLILITFMKMKTKVEVLIHPAGASGAPRRRPKKKAAILREIAGRDMDITPGGLVGGKLKVSAYRQRAIRLAAWLSVLEEASPAGLRELGAPEDTGVILSKNLYGWFERVRRGVYRLHEAGISALNDVPELKELYIKEYDGKQPSTPGSSASHQ
ncbi:MAG: hypothetical protein DRP70_06370 [Spirochaetes bacterium]|nr:MAG: hypothetical protein DRP70_06370 [Spirochaetota bacterium]